MAGGLLRGFSARLVQFDKNEDQEDCDERQPRDYQTKGKIGVFPAGDSKALGLRGDSSFLRWSLFGGGFTLRWSLCFSFCCSHISSTYRVTEIAGAPVGSVDGALIVKRPPVVLLMVYPVL